ncbi:MAG TPA: bile acid:sodium symporter [Planctomycetota bacterium]|nr:bile acid:sodium symporter [Planctomycetota bacterium]
MPSPALALLKKHWFFLGVALVLTLGCLMPNPIAHLSAYTIGPYRLRTWLITLIMLLTAFTLPIRNIGAGAKNWLGLLLMLAMSYGAYPLLTYGVARTGWWLQGVDPTTAPLDQWAYGAGLVIIAAVPTTMASGIIWTRQSGGDDALALVGMILGLLFSIVLTPLVLSWTLFPLLSKDAVDFAPSGMRTQLIDDLTKLILIPVITGQLLRIFKPLAQQGDQYRKEISLLLQIFVLITIWFSVAGQMATATPTTPVAGAVAAVAAVVAPPAAPQLPGLGVLAFLIGSTLLIHCATLALGWGLALLFRQPAPAVICVGLNGAQKTLPVALLVLSLLPARWAHSLDAAVWSFILVHVTQLSVDALLIPHFKAWSERAAAAQAVRMDGGPGSSSVPLTGGTAGSGGAIAPPAGPEGQK